MGRQSRFVAIAKVTGSRLNKAVVASKARTRDGVCPIRQHLRSGTARKPSSLPTSASSGSRAHPARFGSGGNSADDDRRQGKRLLRLRTRRQHPGRSATGWGPLLARVTLGQQSASARHNIPLKPRTNSPADSCRARRSNHIARPDRERRGVTRSLAHFGIASARSDVPNRSVQSPDRSIPQPGGLPPIVGRPRKSHSHLSPEEARPGGLLRKGCSLARCVRTGSDRETCAQSGS